MNAAKLMGRKGRNVETVPVKLDCDSHLDL
jgi:hypothetical protein